MNKIKISIVMAVVLGLMPAAIADVYVKVDANGNAIGEAIMCDAATCGSDSDYSRATLQPGESYQLQGAGHAGIGNNNSGVEVKVDIPTQTWTVIDNNTPTPSVRTFTPDQGPSYVPPRLETNTVIIDTATVRIDTATAVIETSTAQSLEIAALDAKIAELKTLIAYLETLIARFNRW